MKLKNIIPLLLIGLFASCSPSNMIYSDENGAIAGFDPVAYFMEGKPIKGSETFAYSWKGAKWYFSSENNRRLFEEMPESYAPQYGGYCAYAVSQGYTAKVDPNCWKIVDEKLYLNYNTEIQEKWEKDQFEYIMYGDANWPKVLD